MDLQELKEKVLHDNPKADVKAIDAAYEFGRQAHQGQQRASGEEYFSHPVAVAGILADLELDVDTIVAGLLHDVVEDTAVTLEELEQKFGKSVAELVDGVTKLSKLGSTSREERQVESLRKMFLAMARDLRVVLIKLADRLHNMRTLKFMTNAKQHAVAAETLEIYAPLAHRLGISEIKWELEDHCFRVLQPTEYMDVANKVRTKRSEREELCTTLMNDLKSRLEAAGVEADISGRAKHLYSIWKKMRNGRDITDIYDLIAIRVLVNEVPDCYAALGLIHAQYKPLPQRFKDYIATPKPNMYQSLHTTVVGPHGEPFEIQIRTHEMHRTSEYGIAAHWRYKEGSTDKDFDRKLAWLRSILEWQAEYKDAREFVESVKMDVFADQVFVFTPKGRVVDLPAEATPLDFAFAIHSDVGYRCVGAKVNGKIAPLDSHLKNGDIVEILTSKQSPGPSLHWLKIVKTSGAKNKIRQFFKRERREENMERGEAMLREEAKRQSLEPHAILKDDWLVEVGKRFNLTSDEDVYISVVDVTINPTSVINRLREFYDKDRKVTEPPPLPKLPEPKEWDGYGKPTQGIRIKGVDNVLVRFSRCCNPVPGDQVIGYVTRGRGVAVHRLDCPNMSELVKEPDRLIECAWEEGFTVPLPVDLIIHCLDRDALVRDITAIIADSHIPLHSINARATRDKMAIVECTLQVKDLSQLQFLVSKLTKVRDVVSVERAMRELPVVRSTHTGARHANP